MNETELLFTEVLNCDRTYLLARRGLRLDKEQSSMIASALKRRMRNEPIQYILGKTEFMGLEFKVTPDVLIPRPETEILAETALKFIAGRRQARILDLGTGSGCIAVSLAKFLPDAKIIAVDISQKALGVAKHNAVLNKVEDRIEFIQADLFAGSREGYDYIVSNPPYVADTQISGLQPEISFEPASALCAGRDGLDFYRRIIPDSIAYLKEGGALIMEMGYAQRIEIENIFKKHAEYRIIEVVKDYNSIDRVIAAKKGSSKWIS